MNKKVNIPKILIWDDDNLVYYEGVCGSFNLIPDIIEYRTLANDSVNRLQGRDTDFNCSISNMQEKKNIDLDPTLMKRIAKYNKELDVAKLDELIKEKEEYIKELNDVLNDRTKRVDKLRKYIAKIWNIDVSNEDDYEDDYDDECDEW